MLHAHYIIAYISNHVHCCCGASARPRHHLHLSLSTFPPDWQLILQTNTAANKSFSDLEWNASLILTRSVLLHSTSDMIYHFNLSNGINLRSFISPLNVTITTRPLAAGPRSAKCSDGFIIHHEQIFNNSLDSFAIFVNCWLENNHCRDKAWQVETFSEMVVNSICWT